MHPEGEITAILGHGLEYSGYQVVGVEVLKVPFGMFLANAWIVVQADIYSPSPQERTLFRG